MKIDSTTLIKLVLSALFLICLADMSYGYFQLVRFLGMIGFAILAYQEYSMKNSGWAIFYLSSAILINPLFKISLGRELWMIIDIVWAIMLIVTIFGHKKKNLI